MLVKFEDVTYDDKIVDKLLLYTWFVRAFVINVFVADVLEYDDNALFINVLTCEVVLYPDIPAGIVTIPLLLIEIAIMTLCKDIPKEVEVKDRFQPLLPVVKKYRLEPPKKII